MVVDALFVVVVDGFEDEDDDGEDEEEDVAVVVLVLVDIVGTGSVFVVLSDFEDDEVGIFAGIVVTEATTGKVGA